MTLPNRHVHVSYSHVPTCWDVAFLDSSGLDALQGILTVVWICDVLPRPEHIAQCVVASGSSY